jgi:hypothetical protein
MPSDQPKHHAYDLAEQLRPHSQGRIDGVLVVHGTRKFLERVGPPGDAGMSSTTNLGSWYATALFWRPQVALFVNETTLLPVLLPLAPATGVVPRFRSVLGDLLVAHGCHRSFIEEELEAMKHHVLDKTRNRSVVGVMNEFASLAEHHRASKAAVDLEALEHHRASKAAVDLEALAVHLAGTPCGPLYQTHITPDRALAAVAGSGQDDLLRHRKRQPGEKT